MKRALAICSLLVVVLALAPLSASGREFSNPINISNNSGVSVSPTVVMDSQKNVNVIWYDTSDSASGKYDIFFSRSVDGGQHFSSPLNVSRSSDDSWGANRARVAVDSQGNIYIVWADFSKSEYDIFFSRSIDEGQSFSTPLNLSDNSGRSFRPEIAVDNQGDINIVWDDDSGLGHREILFRRSTNIGQTFSNPINLSDELHDTASPLVVVDDQGKIYVAWNQYDYSSQIWDLRISYSDNGATFSVPASISTASSLGVRQMIVDHQGKVNIVLEQCVSADCSFENEKYWEIFFSHSDDGVYFSTPVNVSSNTTRSIYPKLAVDNHGEIKIIWQDTSYINGRGMNDVFFSRSTDGGQSFLTPLNLSEETGNPGAWFSQAPELAVDTWGNIGVVWEDVYATSTYAEVFFSYSSDGENFSSPLNISTTPSVHSFGPSIFMDDYGNVYIAWADMTPGNYDIYFSRYPEILLIDVAIDIKPNSYPNCFNINGSGVIPVAILGSDTLDVTQIDVTTLKFAGMDVRLKAKHETPQCAIEDVSGDFTFPEGSPDGYLDLVCHFEDDPSVWSPDEGIASLTGYLLDGTSIKGMDSICLKP